MKRYILFITIFILFLASPGLTKPFIVPSNQAFSSLWDNVNLIPPSKNAIYDYLHLIDTDDDGDVDNVDSGASASVEEGTWTVDVTCDTSGGYTVDPNKDTGAYTKIGDNVHVQGQISITDEDSPNGFIEISLPFVCADLTDTAGYAVGSSVLCNHGGTIDNGTMPLVTASLSYFTLKYVSDAGGLSTVYHTDVDTNWLIIFSFDYITSN